MEIKQLVLRKLQLQREEESAEGGCYVWPPVMDLTFFTSLTSSAGRWGLFAFELLWGAEYGKDEASFFHSSLIKEKHLPFNMCSYK